MELAMIYTDLQDKKKGAGPLIIAPFPLVLLLGFRSHIALCSYFPMRKLGPIFQSHVVS